MVILRQEGASCLLKNHPRHAFLILLPSPSVSCSSIVWRVNSLQQFCHDGAPVMLGVTGSTHRPCDGLDRRKLLRLGVLAPVILTLPRLLARQARTGGRTRGKARSCLLVFMEGGPSHIDLWELQPAAPAEVRGEFKPTPTSVPGLHFCEHLPRLARLAARLALVRSMTHSITDHNAGTYYSLTGRHPAEPSRRRSVDRG